MKVYCMSDIHGCLDEFNKALSVIVGHLDEPDTMLCLLGDYIHGGQDNYGVIDRIIELQKAYSSDKVVALMGNHEEFVLWGDSTVNHMLKYCDKEYINNDIREDRCIKWMEKLPRFFSVGNIIFVHAGIDEEAGDWWKWGTSDEIFTGKYPAQTGIIEGLEMKIVAGHVGTAEISGNQNFHDIYFDGEAHYYIDGTVLESGKIPVLMVDTEVDRYYQVSEKGCNEILPYNEGN